MVKNIFFIILICLLWMAGCTQSNLIDPDWQPRIGTQISMVEPIMMRSAGPIYITPQSVPAKPLSAFCYNFNILQDVANPKQIGASLGGMFWRMWTGMGVFPSMIYDSHKTWPGLEEALNEVRQKKLDLVVHGQIIDFVAGAGAGMTTITLQVDIYAAEDGALLWSMQHGGRLGYEPDRDYILVRRKTRMPQSPEYIILYALAQDLGKPVRAWNHGHNWRQELGKF